MNRGTRASYVAEFTDVSAYRDYREERKDYGGEGHPITTYILF